MKPTITFLISQSILLPLIIGLIRFRKIPASYRPFLFLLFMGALSEGVSYLVIRFLHTVNAVPNNIYVLLEWLVVCWQFHRWGVVNKRKVQSAVFIGIPVIIWVLEIFVFESIYTFSPYFRIIYSFLIVLLSINLINYVITHESSNLFKNAQFLICLGFIIFYTYQIVYEWAYQMSTTGASGVTTTIILLFGYVNAGVNIIFACAVALIPRHQDFTLH